LDEQFYWDVAERDLEIQNPITDRKLRLLDDYCDVRDGLKILDIGCGKAWLLRQWAGRCEIEGIGVEINRRFVDAARRFAAAQRVGHRLDFVHARAADYNPEPQGFDIVMCIGATFALGGFVEALEWMGRAAKPGGSIVIGDITLKHPPLTRHGPLPHDTVDSIAIIDRHEAEVSATISASDADFERYAAHHRHNTLVWARENPDHPETPEILKRSHDDWMYYQRTIRPMLGWTIFVARRSGLTPKSFPFSAISTQMRTSTPITK
jgi:cyclopropane fatty-acyl-phospholipid synthase-like methyltransferase